MCKNVKQNVLFEQSEFTFCSFCMCKSRPGAFAEHWIAETTIIQLDYFGNDKVATTYKDGILFWRIVFSSLQGLLYCGVILPD